MPSPPDCARPLTAHAQEWRERALGLHRRIKDSPFSFVSVYDEAGIGGKSRRVYAAQVLGGLCTSRRKVQDLAQAFDRLRARAAGAGAAAGDAAGGAR